MTKKELLERLALCEKNLTTVSSIDSDYNERKSKIELINQYRSLIDTALMFCPDEFLLDGLASLDVFECKDGPESFIKNNVSIEIDKRLNAILTEIKTLANVFANKNSEKLRNAATALAIRNEWLSERQKKNHKKVFPIFISIFVVLSVIVVIFAGFDAAQLFAEGTAMAKACAIVSSIAGALDAVNGVAFFIYERNDDKKKKENQNDLEQAISNKSKMKNSGNVIKAGKGSSVHIGDSKASDNNEDALNAYFIKNSKNRIHAGKNAIIDIGDK